MGLVINTNIASLVAQQNLQSTNNQLKVNVQRLSSGYRVNSAADDAAGLARADQLRTQSVSIQAAMRNANDGISALEIADKSAEKITDLLVRMTDLATSASQGTLDATTRGYYNSEWDQLVEEIDRIVATTEFGGTTLLNSAAGTIDIQVGFKSTTNDVLTLNLADLGSATIGVNADDLATQGSAQGAITALSGALKAVNDARAVFGAKTNRLSTTVSNLQVTFTNYQAAESRIRDADFAMETASFTKNQILVQSGVSVLAQANTLPQSALALLR